jgi:CRP-like cAMP-binding protein
MENTVDSDLKQQFVKKQACFAQLNPDETEKLAELFTEVHIKTGDTIVTEGDPVDSVYLIVTGKADVRHVTIENHAPKIQSLATLSDGAAIGLNETGFYSLSGIRTATVVAISDMVLLRLSMPSFHGFSLAYPHVNEIMHRNSENIVQDKF